MAETLTIKQENDKAWPITVKSGGEVVNINGWTFLFRVKKRLADKDSKALIRKTLPIVNAAQGLTKIEISNAESNKTPGTYIYDVRVIDSNGKKRNTDTGKFIIEPVTTQDDGA